MEPTCPLCARPRVDGESCPYCGVVYARYRKRPPPGPTRRRGWGLGSLGLALIVAVGSGLWWRAVRPVPPPAPPSPVPVSVVEVDAPADTDDEGAPAEVFLKTQEPVTVDFVSALGVASVTVPATHAQTETLPRGLRLTSITGSSPVESLRVVILAEGAPSRVRMASIARAAIAEVDGELGPEGTVRRGIQRGLDAAFTGQRLGEPVYGRVQVLPLAADVTAVVFVLGDSVSVGSEATTLGFFNSLQWAPNLQREVVDAPACTVPAPTTRPVVIGLADLSRRLQDLEGCVVVVEIWATDCGACQSPHAAVRTLSETYQEEGLALFQVAIDDDPEAVAQWLLRDRLRSPALVLSAAVQSDLGPQLARHGMSWDGTRPYFALLSRPGAVLHSGSTPPTDAQVRRAL